VKENPKKPYLGTREKVKKEDGTACNYFLLVLIEL
jgi:hypothetical protein